jgi:hypothetical protein
MGSALLRHIMSYGGKKIFSVSRLHIEYREPIKQPYILQYRKADLEAMAEIAVPVHDHTGCTEDRKADSKKEPD